MIDGLVNFEKMVSSHTHRAYMLISSVCSSCVCVCVCVCACVCVCVCVCSCSLQRLLAEKVRALFEFRTGSLHNDVRLLANKNTDLQTYTR